MRRFLFKVAIAGVVINLLGGAYAWLTNEPMHGMVHGGFLVGFAIWARYLHQTREYNAYRQDIREDRIDKVDLLEADLTELQRELHETQQRLNFADQLLKKKQEPGN
ncbi:MAG TPA: hypothetical protein VM100_11255 [Longimicrobiales bacterium]|nr:hypothetical protein [Longimicrobiales bacterium]